MRKIAVFALLLWPTATFGQVPPPPIPNSQALVLESIRAAYDRKDVPLYEGLLEDNVIVTIDNKVVARSKAEWLGQFAKKLSTDGVLMNLKDVYQAAGRLMTIEYFNSVESFRSQSRDCCWRYDAVQYAIKGDKIIAISILSGGDVSR